MPCRLPTLADFPSDLTISIVPPAIGTPVNALILLHGLGDSNKSFSQLGKSLNLPETVAISLQGPNPIPSIFTGSETPSFHWGDDVLIDETNGGIEMDAGFKTSEEIILRKVIEEGLVKNCGFPPRNILIYGFGQGGMAAALVAAASEMEFAGVVNVGGRLPASSLTVSRKSTTPILSLGGSRSSQLTRSAIDGLKLAFANVEYVKWAKNEDSMPKSRDEMLPIMKFFARRLRSRAGVPEGAVEV